MNRHLLLIFMLITICVLSSLLYIEYFSPSVWTKDTDIIIVSAHWNENLDWLTQLDIPVIVCGKDGEEKAAIDSNETCKNKNKGREASSYLKFIIAHYDNLPKNIAFIHGHQNAWHQNADILETIQNGEWKKNEYTSLNNKVIDDWGKGHNLWERINNLWPKYFKDNLQMDFPERLRSDCCAQFIVARNRIQRHSKEVYEKWLELSTEKYNEYNLTDQEMAVGFEWIWHVIFGEPVIR
jgi:hypothetical protein